MSRAWPTMARKHKIPRNGGHRSHHRIIHLSGLIGSIGAVATAATAAAYASDKAVVLVTLKVAGRRGECPKKHWDDLRNGASMNLMELPPQGLTPNQV